MAALGVSAVKSYAEYEQLVGGIETLFGAGGASVEEYADKVGKSVSDVQDEYNTLMEAQTLALDNADNAYKTAGLSANEYMETVTGFAASLKQSTADEVEAAKAANQAVIDMSDNANKMGTSMESIQNAYQGFAKQNYTMLDNLKLGYGGTKEEMQRLLADAEKLTGIKYDISNLSDVYSAIHVIQTELGITGTTAKEASTTISGSVNAMKASWSNLVVGIADDTQDFDVLVNNFVESAATVADNLLPRIEIAIKGIGTLIEKLFPVIAERIPAIINDVLPDLIQSGISMVGSLVDGIEQNLPQVMESAGEIIDQLMTAILEMSPRIVEVAVQLIGTLAQGIIDNLPELMDAAGGIISLLIDTLVQMLPQLIEIGLQMITELALGISQALPELIPTIVDVLLEVVNTLVDNIGMLATAAVQLIQGLADGLINALPVLIERLPEIIMNIVNTLIEYAPQLIKAAEKVIMTLADGIVTYLPQLLEMLPDLIVSIVTALIDNAPMLMEAALEFITIIARALIKYIPQLLKSIPQIIAALVDSFISLGSKLYEIGSEYVGQIKNAISEKWNELVGSVAEWVGNLISGFTDSLGAGVQSIKDVFVNGWNSIMEFFTETLPSLPEKILYWLSYTFTSIVLWGVDLINWAITNIPIFVDNIVNFIAELPGKIAVFLGQVIKSVISWGNNMLTKAVEVGGNFVSGVVNFIKTLPSKIAAFLGEVISKVTGFASDMKNKAVEAGQGFFNNIVSALSDLPSKMGEIGGNIVAGIMTGISNGWGKLVDYVKDLANSLFQGAKDALEIHSPSRKFKWLAEMCVAGFDEGMDDFMNPDAMTRSINASMSTMQANMTGARAGGGVGGFGNFNQTINVNQQISTPDELARAVRLESRYGLMRGTAFG